MERHTRPFNGPFSRTTRVGRYQKGKTNLDFTEARDSEWQWHQLGHMQVCPLLQADNHASTPPLSFLQAGCPSCHPTNSVKALKASAWKGNRSKSTDNPSGRHPIWTIGAPPPLSPIFTPNALSAATLPIYPGLGQAPNNGGLHTWWLGLTKQIFHQCFCH